MKKILSTVAAAAVLTTSSFASDVNFDTNKAYVGAGIGLEMVDYFDSGFALVLNGGVPFMEAGPGTLGVEGELTFSIIAPSLGNYDSDSIVSVGTYATYTYDINNEIYVKPRAGFVYTSWHVSEFALALGVQGGYKINNQLDATLGFTMNTAWTGINYLTAGIQYNF